MSESSRGLRASLAGIDPLEALRALLAVDPDSEPVADDPDDDEAPAD